MAFGINMEQSINLNLGRIFFPVKQAVILATILSEICTNAFKYAFPNNDAAELYISLVSTNKQQYSLVVFDNGKGQLDTSKNTLGIAIIKQLTDDIYGQLEITEKDGVHYSLTFMLNLKP